MPAFRPVEAKEFSDTITAALRRAKRGRRGFIVMCLVALAIIGLMCRGTKALAPSPGTVPLSLRPMGKRTPSPMPTR